MIRVFPRRTAWTPKDGLAFVGDPTLFRPTNRQIPVRISCTFTWDRMEALRLWGAWQMFYDDVKVGGPAFWDEIEQVEALNSSEGFIPGRFIKPGVTFTSRGCNRRCKYCFVPTYEGNLRELPVIPGNIIQDNNFLMTSDRHQDEVFEMLQDQTDIRFSGGLDSRLFRRKHAKKIEALGRSVRQLWFAADDWDAVRRLVRVADLLQGFSIEKKFVYVLLEPQRGQSIDEARKRLEAVYELGFFPFAQIYRSPADGKVINLPEWRALAKTWSRPALIKKEMKYYDEVQPRKKTTRNRPAGR